MRRSSSLTGSRFAAQPGPVDPAWGSGGFDALAPPARQVFPGHQQKPGIGDEVEQIACWHEIRWI